MTTIQHFLNKMPRITINGIFHNILTKHNSEVKMIIDKIIDDNYNFEEYCNEGLKYAI